MKNNLLKKIENRTAKIGIIGLGYVGLPLAVAFAKTGFIVQGYDQDAQKIAVLKKGESDVIDIQAEQLKPLILNKQLKVSMSKESLSGMDVLLICVPTPLNEHYEPNVSAIESAVQTIIQEWSDERLIILESTTYPGSSRELIYDVLLKTGKLDKDFLVAYSPERVDPGNQTFNVENTPKVVGGINQDSLEVTSALYETIVEQVVPVSSTEVAEMSKLLENTFRTINIAFVNEMLQLCESFGIDVWEAIDASSTKPFGFMRFLPGPGVGGHCIPLDPMYLSWKAKENNFFSKFIEIAHEINHKMSDYLMVKIMELLNKQKKSVKGSKILLLGMAYKENIDDLRESPSLEIYENLTKLEAVVDFCDPLVKEFRDKKGTIQETIPLDYDVFGTYDLVVALVSHDCFDKKAVINKVTLILDTKNIFKNEESNNVVKMGGS